MSSWQHPKRCSGHVIVGRALVVAQITVEFMTWWARTGISQLSGRGGMDSLGVRLGEPWAERQGLPVTMAGG